MKIKYEYMFYFSLKLSCTLTNAVNMLQLIVYDVNNLPILNFISNKISII